MAAEGDQQSSLSTNEVFQGNGFIIKDCIIKGDQKFYPIDAESIGELIMKILVRIPEHIWQIDAVTGKKTTFKILKEQSVRLAIWLKKEGIVSGDIITLCTPSNPNVESILFATMFLGATYNHWPYNLTLQSARDFINLIKPKVIFTWANKVDLLRQAAELENHVWKLIVIDKDTSSHETLDDIIKDQSPDELLKFQITSGINPSNNCAIMPTSGTTGILKFVYYSYENCLRWCSKIDIEKELKNTSKVSLLYLHPEWDAHFRFLLHDFLVRNTLVYHEKFEPQETCKIIEMYKVNTMVLYVYAATLLCQDDSINKYDVQSLSLITPLGGNLFDTVATKLRKIFNNAVIGKTYGMTETYLLTSFTDNCRNRESQGTVIPNVQLRIVDLETGLALGPNKVGEIRAKTAFIMNGYYQNPEATKLAFDDDGWFCTGDEGYYDENGEIVIAGRLKERIKFRFSDLHPPSVEKMIVSHPNIVDAAVIGIPHEIDVERPIAFVKINPGSVVTEEDILKLTCELKFSDTFKNSVVFVDEIPRSNNGKIDRRLLKGRAEKLFASS